MIERNHVYETLKNKLGENETEVLLQYVDGIVTTKVASKEDLARLDGRFDRLEDAFRHLNEKAATREDLARLEGRLGRLEEGLRHLNEKAATKEDLVRLDGRIGRLEEVIPYLATKQQVAEVAGHLTAQIVELAGKIDALPKDVDLKLAKLGHQFQLSFVALALLVVLTNPKAIELFGKLMGWVK